MIGKFQTKVMLAFVLPLLVLAALANFLLYKYTLNSQFNQIQENLKIIAQTAALGVDADTLLNVPLNREGVNDDTFKRTAEKLKRIKEANPSLRYIYTMKKTAIPGVWQFIVDPEPGASKALPGEPTSFPGQHYDVTRFPEMQKAFDGPSVDRELSVDEWGVTLSGYAPVFGRDGKAVAILGVDLDAKEIYAMRRNIRARALVILLFAAGISIVLGFVISKNVTSPVRKLVEGTRKIASGDLSFKVQVKAQDEIGELAASFNEMAHSLSESNRKLHEYFYRVVQSMVRSLEAKDPYTKGHSDRVSEYSKAIAVEMGIPAERVELLINAAQLHDIGKLGIHEDILNKQGILSETEWDMIYQHPVVGENILRPVFMDDEMLTVVRSHHERCDGKGYPDGLNVSQITIFAQIVAVADAFDAMTSSRAYRTALTHEEAIARLRRDAGSQFTPQIVEALVKTLKEKG